MAYDSIELKVTTDAGGDGTATATRSALGEIVAFEWDKGTFDNGVDATVAVTSADTGNSRNILVTTDFNTSGMFYIRAAIRGQTAAALTYDGTRPVSDRVLLNGTLKLTIAQGGATKTGSMVVYFRTT